MRLPGRERAYVPFAKLSGYLLSESHSVGRGKAKLFRGAGFNESNVSLLEQRLLEIAHSAEVSETVSSSHGTKYVVEGMLETPEGSFIRLLTVWIVDTGTDRPRFVTAYPA